MLSGKSTTIENSGAEGGNRVAVWTKEGSVFLAGFDQITEQGQCDFPVHVAKRRDLFERAGLKLAERAF